MRPIQAKLDYLIVASQDVIRHPKLETNTPYTCRIKD